MVCCVFEKKQKNFYKMRRNQFGNLILEDGYLKGKKNILFRKKNGKDHLDTKNLFSKENNGKKLLEKKEEERSAYIFLFNFF